MRDAIERMYASGELDRLLRWCGVKEADLPDLRQEVAEILLTTAGIKNLQAYTVSVINRQYKSKKSRWWRKYGRWNANRNGLQNADGQVSADSELGHLGDGQPQAEDVPCAGHAKRQRADNLPAGGGAWHNSGGRKTAKGTQEYNTQAVSQDTKQDKK